MADQGKAVFKEKIKQLISNWQPSIHPFDISLANLNLLSKKQTHEGLTKYGESLDKSIKCYEDLEKFLIDSKCPLGNIQLATRRIYILKGEKKWLTKFIKNYQ